MVIKCALDTSAAWPQDRLAISPILSEECHLLGGSGIALKPRRPMLPLCRKRKSITVGHLDLRETMIVHHVVFLDNTIFVQRKAVRAYTSLGLSDPFLPSGIRRLM